jgi:glycosyltransferase involved in cell wall biosynthesis
LFLLECFQAGLPAIATRIGEIPQLFEPISGFRPGSLVGLRDGEPDPDELTSAVIRLASNGPEFTLMQQAARAVARKYNINELASYYIGICSELVGSKDESAAA